MPTLILKDCKLYLGGHDLSGDMNNMGIDYGAELQDDTTMGDDTRSNKSGLKTVGAAHEGFWQADDVLVSDTLWERFAIENEVMTVAPETGAVAETAYSFHSVLAEYSPGGSVGDMLAFTVNASGTGTLYKGTIVEASEKLITGSGTARELGAVAAGQKVYASLHVLAVSGTNPTLDVVIQSDDAELFGDSTARITFAQMNAIGGQLLAADGAVTDEWWRAVWTVGGTDDPAFTILVVVGIL